MSLMGAEEHIFPHEEPKACIGEDINSRQMTLLCEMNLPWSQIPHSKAVKFYPHAFCILPPCL